MANRLPSRIFLCPTQDFADGEPLDGVLFAWDAPPPVGSILLLVPSDRDQSTRLVDRIFTVISVTESKDKEWPWDLDVEEKTVALPRSWYELVRESQIRGLVPLSGGADEEWTPVELTHTATIEMIYELLGEL
jgi:hypothetical protein